MPMRRLYSRARAFHPPLTPSAAAGLRYRRLSGWESAVLWKARRYKPVCPTRLRGRRRCPPMQSPLRRKQPLLRTVVPPWTRGEAQTAMSKRQGGRLHSRGSEAMGRLNSFLQSRLNHGRPPRGRGLTCSTLPRWWTCSRARRIGCSASCLVRNLFSLMACSLVYGGLCSQSVAAYGTGAQTNTFGTLLLRQQLKFPRHRNVWPSPRDLVRPLKSPSPQHRTRALLSLPGRCTPS